MQFSEELQEKLIKYMHCKHGIFMTPSEVEIHLFSFAELFFACGKVAAEPAPPQGAGAKVGG